MAFFVLWFPVGVVLPFKGWQDDLVDMCFNEVEYNCIVLYHYFIGGWKPEIYFLPSYLYL